MARGPPGYSRRRSWRTSTERKRQVDSTELCLSPTVDDARRTEIRGHREDGPRRLSCRFVAADLEEANRHVQQERLHVSAEESFDGEHPASRLAVRLAYASTGPW